MNSSSVGVVCFGVSIDDVCFECTESNRELNDLITIGVGSIKFAEKLVVATVADTVEVSLNAGERSSLNDKLSRWLT